MVWFYAAAYCKGWCGWFVLRVVRGMVVLYGYILSVMVWLFCTATYCQWWYGLYSVLSVMVWLSWTTAYCQWWYGWFALCIVGMVLYSCLLSVMVWFCTAAYPPGPCAQAPAPADGHQPQQPWLPGHAPGDPPGAAGLRHQHGALAGQFHVPGGSLLEISVFIKWPNPHKNGTRCCP